MPTDRRVKQSGKNRDGDVMALCNPAEAWSPQKKADAIADIENGTYRYYVEEQVPRVYVQVYTLRGVKHLRTTADRHSRNNLDNLPDC